MQQRRGHVAQVPQGDGRQGSARPGSLPCWVPVSARRFCFCEAPTQWVYRGDVADARLFRALVEMWSLKDSGDRTTVRWTLAADPNGLVRALTTPARPLLRWLFRQAMRRLGTGLAQEQGTHQEGRR
ncbi:SRPBCC family protein [Streptomyces sp. NPDC001135]